MIKEGRRKFRTGTLEAPLGMHTSVADAAEEHGWSGGEDTDVAKELANPDIPEERKQALVDGTQEPVTTKNGEVGNSSGRGARAPFRRPKSPRQGGS